MAVRHSYKLLQELKDNNNTQVKTVYMVNGVCKMAIFMIIYVCICMKIYQALN